MAVFAAVAGLLAGHHANEALIERVKASDQWNFYQSKNLKEEIAVNTDKILHALESAGQVTGNEPCREIIARISPGTRRKKRRSKRRRRRRARVGSPSGQACPPGHRRDGLPDRHRHLRHRHPYPEKEIMVCGASADRWLGSFFYYWESFPEAEKLRRKFSNAAIAATLARNLQV